jgi:hypothetical protein
LPVEAPYQIWVRRAFWTLALLYVIPFWVVNHIPTTDGPCHLYNAWVLRQLDNPAEYPRFAEHYAVDPRPHPNWLTHGALFLLTSVFPPLLAEKILASGYVLLLLGGMWRLCSAVRPAYRWTALLAFPFVFNQFFQLGFYNFSLSLGLMLLTVAVWWRHRESFTLSAAVQVNLLFLVLWFAHVVSFLFALLAIGVLWLTSLRRPLRPRLLQIPALLPQLVLPLWFLSVQGAASYPSPLSPDALARYLLRLEVLFTFSALQLQAAVVLSLLFFGLILLTLATRRTLWQPEDGFLLVALLAAAIFFWSPEGMSGGSLLKQRLSLYPFLFLIPWLAPTSGRVLRGVLAGALTLLAAVNLGYVVYWYDVLGREMETYLAGFEKVAPNTRLLPLLFDRGSAAVMGPYGHAAAYVALEKGLIDWDNYAAVTDLFPVRFKTPPERSMIRRIELYPAEFPLAAHLHEIDYVHTWSMPPDAPIARILARKYHLIWADGRGALYARRNLRF